MADRKPRVELVPWDFDSEEHRSRMYLQRQACGWRSQEVQQWVELGRAGTKTLYWIVLRDDLADREELMSQHLAENPKESTPIKDTAPTHWQEPRQAAADRGFIPVGHVALDLREEENRQLGLSSDDGAVVWVAGLYVSWALQRYGLGREVMRLAEELAARSPPLRAGWVVLDTMAREQQMKPSFVSKMYLARGKPAPKVPTQDWYERQGYEVFDQWVGAYKWVDPDTGAGEDIDYIFLRKKLQ